jgi:hypothetical protein
MRVVYLALLALIAGCSSTRCYPDCIYGYEPIPGECSCRPIPDGGGSAGGPLSSCREGSACATGSRCIVGCPYLGSFSPNPANGICSVPGRDTCGCGGVLDPCDLPGTVCLMPACCDYQGICVTPDERAAICARPEGSHFDCTTVDAGP